MFINLQNLHLLQLILSLHLFFPSPPSALGTHHPHVESNLYRPQCVGLTLVAKLKEEKFIQRSGLNYTIVRPGGLRDDSPSGNLVMEPEIATHPPPLHNSTTLFSSGLILCFQGSILRDQVAEFAVGALLCSESSFKRPLAELLRSIRQH
ncbi:unnamed protein product [Spirodela intermedia]|uniref:NAD(P)-binding domain-containing protein n=1 Tax=Spirodela intermedia TaxID=51605 RepID=A0ABN7ECH5_SPIIN|nr:unnamed protein product [Spirodela intermedia]